MPLIDISGCGSIFIQQNNKRTTYHTTTTTTKQQQQQHINQQIKNIDIDN